MYQHVLPDDQGQGVIIEDTNHLNKERLEKMCQHNNNKLGEKKSVFIPCTNVLYILRRSGARISQQSCLTCSEYW